MKPFRNTLLASTAPGPPPGAGPVLPPDLAERFPRLAAYVASLPMGMRSYPECRVRTATYADVLLGGPAALPSYDGVDARVRELIGEPPRGLWIPTVLLLAGIAAVGDQYQLSPEQHYQWLLERNRALLRNGIYRAVMAFFSPEILMRKASERWTSFHQGSVIRFERTSQCSGVLELTFPPALFDEPVARVFGAVFAAALERANASWARLSVRDYAPTRVAYLAEWR